MSNVKYSLVEDETGANITVFADGQMYVTTSENPKWDEILDAVRNGVDADFEALFDPAVRAKQRFDALADSDRVKVSGGQVYFDGDLVDNALTKQILRFLEDDVQDFKPLVRFFEKMAGNPQEHSREQFYAWLQRHEFTITESGNVLMYKGVAKDADGNFVSIHHGPGIVNGEAQSGALRNNVGDVVEIARSKVEFNPGVGCASGLHAGTYEYAKDFSRGGLLTVEVNPRDVVSVPTDCDAQKVRVSRYVVREVTPAKYESAVVSWGGSHAEDECYDCGAEGNWTDTEGYCGICY